MSNIWTDRWNERYSNEAYAYGQDPNDFLKQELKKISPAKILFPAVQETLIRFPIWNFISIIMYTP